MRLRFCFVSLITLLLSFSTAQVGYAGTPNWIDLEWSPDGMMLAAVGGQGITLFSKNLEVMGQSGYRAYGVSWNADGTQLAVTMQNGSWADSRIEIDAVSIWNTEPFEWTGSTEVDPHFVVSPSPVFWRDDGLYVLGSKDKQQSKEAILVVNSNTLQFEDSFNIDSPDEYVYEDTFTLNNTISRLAYTSVIINSANDRDDWNYFVHILDYLTEEQNSIQLPGDVRSAVWSNNGEMLVVGGVNYVNLYDSSGKLLKNFDMDGAVSNVEWSPDDLYLALSIWGEHESNFEIWEAETGRVLKNLRTAKQEGEYDTPNNVYSIAWHPNGQLIAGGLLDGEVLLFDVSDLQYPDTP